MKQDWKVSYQNAKTSLAASASLPGRRWRLTDVNGVTVKSTDAYLEFDLQAQRISGNGGCNRLAGNFYLNGKAIRFSQIISTRRACVEGDIQKLETDFLKALEEVTDYQIEGGLLRLSNGARAVLTFKTEGDALSLFRRLSQEAAKSISRLL